MRAVAYVPAARGRVAGLRKGARVAIMDGSEADVNEISAALAAAGFNVLASSVDVDAVLILSGMMQEDAPTRHWSALSAARSAKHTSKRLVFLQRPEPASGLEGLSRTLRKEWPSTDTFTWTLQSGADVSLIPHALAAGYGDGLLTPDGHQMEPVLGHPVAPPRQSVSAPGVWLVTGGARGVTAACAIDLARTAGGSILLAGRSAEQPWPTDLPDTRDIKVLRGLLAARARAPGERVSPAELDRTARNLLAGAEIRDTLTAIRNAGADVAYIPIDAGNADSVSTALAGAQRQHGPITGWVHGAGVLADKLADDKTEAELRRVFAPKVGGLENILRALDPTQLAHVAFFSSAAAFFGNRGQSDYAMANALLANAAHALKAAAPQAQVKVYHWGPWAGGMVDAGLASHFEAQGIPLIPIDEGARIFTSELLFGDPDIVELVVGQAWAAA